MPFRAARRGHTLFMMIFFACLGFTTEVVFTAITDAVNNTPSCDSPVLALAGKSYVWMIFIYACIPLLGHYLHHRVRDYHIVFRLLFYVSLIYIIEFTSGLLLQKLMGRCPWQYTEGWNIMGLIRLDYLPAWLLFCWILERLYVFINKRVIQ